PGFFKIKLRREKSVNFVFSWLSKNGCFRLLNRVLSSIRPQKTRKRSYSRTHFLAAKAEAEASATELKI
ncbi:MAG: hypothetical protein PHH01_05030, partial [Patescibacteria group bacterium]|nr:hypothetical protein [Patescibacteria group bacterium]